MEAICAHNNTLTSLGYIKIGLNAEEGKMNEPEHLKIIAPIQTKGQSKT